MKIYIRAYWYDEDESVDDFIYRPTTNSNEEWDEDIYEVLPYDPDIEDSSYGDFDDYDNYGYSEYEDFYDQVLRRRIYVPINVAHDIPDYNAYRKSLFNTLFLSMRDGESIEDLYDELSTAFPGIVKPDYINVSDMLLEIVDATLYAQSLLKPQ